MFRTYLSNCWMYDPDRADFADVMSGHAVTLVGWDNSHSWWNFAMSPLDDERTSHFSYWEKALLDAYAYALDSTSPYEYVETDGPRTRLAALCRQSSTTEMLITMLYDPPEGVNTPAHSSLTPSVLLGAAARGPDAAAGGAAYPRYERFSRLKLGDDVSMF